MADTKIPELDKIILHGKIKLPAEIFFSLCAEWNSLVNNYALTRVFLEEACLESPLKRRSLSQPIFKYEFCGKYQPKYRPLTFRESLYVRVNDYETLDRPDGSRKTEAERQKDFFEEFYTCTGIAYKADTSLVKIIPVCQELIMLKPAENVPSVAVDYDSLEGYEYENSYNWHTGSYCPGLSLHPDDALNNPGWRAAVEEDLNLLKSVSQILISLKTVSGMGFYTVRLPDHDELRALAIESTPPGTNSLYAEGARDLNTFVGIQFIICF